MGGNALKKVETHRLPAKEYFELVREFEFVFSSVFGFVPRVIRAYNNKESFGDADFLVDASLLPPNWIEMLVSGFRLTTDDYVKNSNVVSMNYKNFQVDLIVTAREHMGSSMFYFSYNDFGNLIGRIGHKLGIKIGHKGISIVVRHKDRNDHILREIFLTNDTSVALDILGLDRARYIAGFDTLEDIFKYVSSSKYFDPEIFSLEHRSAVSRIRDKKRATYSAFLKWVQTETPTRNHDFSEKSELGGYSIRLPYYNTEVLPRFPWVEQEVNTIIAQEELDIQFKKVYNGEVVSDITGFKEKRLGAFMSLLKPMFTPEVKHAFVNSPRLARHAIAAKYEDVGGVSFMVDTDDTN